MAEVACRVVSVREVQFQPMSLALGVTHGWLATGGAA